jgi:hypothetical protein
LALHPPSPTIKNCGTFVTVIFIVHAWELGGEAKTRSYSQGQGRVERVIQHAAAATIAVIVGFVIVSVERVAEPVEPLRDAAFRYRNSPAAMSVDVHTGTDSLGKLNRRLSSGSGSSCF